MHPAAEQLEASLRGRRCGRGGLAAWLVFLVLAELSAQPGDAAADEGECSQVRATYQPCCVGCSFPLPPAPAPSPCVEPYLESCLYDFSDCVYVLPGENCEVACRSPYFGAPASASCPSDNEDPIGGLLWQGPQCNLVCPEPVPIPNGYKKVGGVWRCADGYVGEPLAECNAREADCVADLSLSGCALLRPCRPVLLELEEDACVYNMWNCTEVGPGGSCTVSCEFPYVGQPVTGFCPDSNTDADAYLSYEDADGTARLLVTGDGFPTCDLTCPDPALLNPAYVASTTPGRFAECSPGFLGEAEANCTISGLPQCTAVLDLEGCSTPPTLVPCAPLAIQGDDACPHNTSACGALAPGATCRVPCREPYFVGEFPGIFSVASCSPTNADPLAPPMWEVPQLCEMICTEPSTPPAGYVEFEGEWLCAAGYDGAAVLTCTGGTLATECKSYYDFSGCIPLHPISCVPLHTPDACQYATVDCDNVAPGDFCLVYCRKPYQANWAKHQDGAWGSSGGWPAYCDAFNVDPKASPKCLASRDFGNLTDCFEDWCVLYCPFPDPLPVGYEYTAKTGTWSCAKGFDGIAVASCETDWRCAPVLLIFGCSKLEACLPETDDCIVDVAECESVSSGSTCTRRCQPPYIGAPMVLSCPAGNTDPIMRLIGTGGENDQCTLSCPDPDVIPVGYQRVQGPPREWKCSSVAWGTAQVTCELMGSTCQTKYGFAGCNLLQPCLEPKPPRDICVADVSACLAKDARQPGSSCNIMCGPAYRGGPLAQVASCPADNTDERKPLDNAGWWQCKLYCASPVELPEGYELKGNGNWACALGFRGQPESVCKVSETTCEGELILSGCNSLPLVPCGNFTGADDPCRYDVPKECYGLEPGATCAVSCQPPYEGPLVTAKCPDENVDPWASPDLAPLQCDLPCPLPVVLNPVYAGTQMEPTCGPGYAPSYPGAPVYTCLVGLGCAYKTEITGCEPLQRCGGSLEADECKFDTSACSSVGPGEICQVSCLPPYAGAGAVAVCPANNTDRFFDPVLLNSSCAPTCPEGAPPPGYVKVDGAWNCATGYAGRASGGCVVGGDTDDGDVSTTCLPRLELEGCLPIVPCAPIILTSSIRCEFDVSACGALAAGATCSLGCLHPFELPSGGAGVASCPANNTDASAHPTLSRPGCSLPCPEPLDAPEGYNFTGLGQWECADGRYEDPGPSVSCDVDALYCERKHVWSGCSAYEPCKAFPAAFTCMFPLSFCSNVPAGEDCVVQCLYPYPETKLVVASCPVGNTNSNQLPIFSSGSQDFPCGEPTCIYPQSVPAGYAQVGGEWVCASGYMGEVIITCVVEPSKSCSPDIVLSGCGNLSTCLIPTDYPESVWLNCSGTTLAAGSSCDVNCAIPHFGPPSLATCPTYNVDPTKVADWTMPACKVGVSCKAPCASDLSVVAPGTCNGPIEAGGSCWTSCRYGHSSNCASQSDVLFPTWILDNGGSDGFIELALAAGSSAANLSPYVLGNMTTVVLSNKAKLTADFGHHRVLTGMEVKWGASGSARDYQVLLKAPSGWTSLALRYNQLDEPYRVDTITEAWEVTGEALTIILLKTHASINNGGQFVIEEIKFSAHLETDDTPGHTVFICPRENLNPYSAPIVWRPCELRCDVCQYAGYNDYAPESHVIEANALRTGPADRMGKLGKSNISGFLMAFVNGAGQRVGDLALDGSQEMEVSDSIDYCCNKNKYTAQLLATRVPRGAAKLAMLYQTEYGEVPTRYRGRALSLVDIKPDTRRRRIPATTGTENRTIGMDTCDLFRCSGFYAPTAHRRRRVVCGGRRCYERECCELREVEADPEISTLAKEWSGGNFSDAYVSLSGGRVLACLADASAPCGDDGFTCAVIHCIVLGPTGERRSTLEYSIVFAGPHDIGLAMAPAGPETAILCYGKGWFSTGGAGTFSECRMLRAKGPYYDGGLDLFAAGPQLQLHLKFVLATSSEAWAVGQVRLAPMADGLVGACYTAFKPHQGWLVRSQAVYCNLLELLDENVVEVYNEPVRMDYTAFTSFDMARLFPHEPTWREEEVGWDDFAVDGGMTTTFNPNISTTSTTTEAAKQPSAVVCYLKEHTAVTGWETRSDLNYLEPWKTYATAALREIKCCALTRSSGYRGAPHRRRREFRQDRCLYVANATDSIRMSQAGAGVIVLCYRNNEGSRCATIFARGQDQDLMLHMSDVIIEASSPNSTVVPAATPQLLGPGRLAVCYRREHEEGAQVADDDDEDGAGNLSRAAVAAALPRSIVDVRCAGFDVTHSGLVRQAEPAVSLLGNAAVAPGGEPIHVHAGVQAFEVPHLSVVPCGNDSAAINRRSALVCDAFRAPTGGSWRTECRVVKWRAVLTTTTTTRTQKPAHALPVQPDVRRRRSKLTTTTTTRTKAKTVTTTTGAPGTTRKSWIDLFTTTKGPDPYTYGLYIGGSLSVRAAASMCDEDFKEDIQDAVRFMARWSLLGAYAAAQSLNFEGVRLSTKDVTIHKWLCTEPAGTSRRLQGSGNAGNLAFQQISSVVYEVRVADSVASASLELSGAVLGDNLTTDGLGLIFKMALGEIATTMGMAYVETKQAVLQTLTVPPSTTTVTPLPLPEGEWAAGESRRRGVPPDFEYTAPPVRRRRTVPEPATPFEPEDGTKSGETDVAKVAAGDTEGVTIEIVFLASALVLCACCMCGNLCMAGTIIRIRRDIVRKRQSLKQERTMLKEQRREEAAREACMVYGGHDPEDDYAIGAVNNSPSSQTKKCVLKNADESIAGEDFFTVPVAECEEPGGSLGSTPVAPALEEGDAQLALGDKDRPRRISVPGDFLQAVAVQLLAGDTELVDFGSRRSQTESSKAKMAQVATRAGELREKSYEVGEGRGVGAKALAIPARDKLLRYWPPPGWADKPAHCDFLVGVNSKVLRAGDRHLLAFTPSQLKMQRTAKARAKWKAANKRNAEEPLGGLLGLETSKADSDKSARQPQPSIRPAALQLEDKAIKAISEDHRTSAKAQNRHWDERKAVVEQALEARWAGVSKNARKFLTSEGAVYMQQGLCAGSVLLPKATSDALPKDWSMRQSRRGGFRYYVNEVSGEMTRQHPGQPALPGTAQEEPYYDPRDIPQGWERFQDLSAGEWYYVNPVTGNVQWEHPADLPDAWEEILDPDTGESYYANKETGEVSWDHPFCEVEEEEEPPTPARSTTSQHELRRSTLPSDEPTRSYMQTAPPSVSAVISPSVIVNLPSNAASAPGLALRTHQQDHSLPRGPP